MPRCARQLKQNSCSGAPRLAPRTTHKHKAEDAWSCERRRRKRRCSSRSAIRRPDAGSCHRGRELVAWPKTAGDPAASAVLRALCAMRRAPPAPAFFYEHAEIRPAWRSALHITQFTARLESIFAHGQEGAALQRLRGLTLRHRLIMHTSHTATYTHTHAHTHTPSTHARTHARTHAHTHTHINIFHYMYTSIYNIIYINMYIY